MMGGNNNFLLKIHMEENNKITEIYLNKERRSFTFVNDECVSDLIIPEFKITSLNMMLENINDDSGYETYYAEYEKNGETEKEFDREKIAVIRKMVTEISINDFLEYQKNIKLNDYYIDNVVDAYNCVLPIEMKKILSYTTNGVAFSGDEKLEMMSHDSITKYKGSLKNFIPFMMKKQQNYIGYDYKECLYKEYDKDDLVKSSESLKELLLGSPSTKKESIEKLFETGELEKIPIKNEQETVEEEYSRTIQNIDLQLEKLSAGIIVKEENKKKELAKNKEKPENIISDEIGKEAKEMLVKVKTRDLKSKLENKKKEQESKTHISNEVVQEAEEVLKRMNLRECSKRNKNMIVSDDLFQEAEEVLEKIIARENQDRENRFQILSEAVVKEAEKLLKRLSQNKEKSTISKELAEEAEEVLKKVTARENKNKQNNTLTITEEVVKEAEEVLKKINARRDKEKSKNIISKEVAKEAESILNKIKTEEKRKREEIMMNNINKKIQSAIIEYEIRESVRENLDEIEKTNKIIDEINETIIKVKERSEEEEQKEKISISDLVNNSILNGINNYRINLNETQKLVVEHLPYYEFTNEFDVIQIPEIEFDKITLLPNIEIDFGKIKLIVEGLHNDKVDLLVQSANLIVDKDNNKIKKGSHLTIDIKNEITLRLNKKEAMETWSLKMEKSTFEKELRNIDFCRLMNAIKKINSYKKLGNIEKYELQKSVMLFIEFVMQYSENNKLERLYEILEEEPTLYEEFITKYNIKHSQEYQDVLSTYEDKKNYVNKLNYVNGLIDAKWLDYPRYIFNSHNYFYSNDFLEEFINEINNTLTETDFQDYLNRLFDEYDFFKNLDETGKMNLDKCLQYLSVLYKYRPDIGEDNKYKIEKAFMIGDTEEDIALLISKLCRKGIRDYSVFIEYDSMIKEKYRLGDLKYPIYSSYFELDEIRKGGEYDEF